MHKVTMLSLLW